jgi:hypothetical protein
MEQNREAWLRWFDEIKPVYGWPSEDESDLPSCLLADASQLFHGLSSWPEIRRELHHHLLSRILGQEDENNDTNLTSTEATQEISNCVWTFLRLHSSRFVFRTASGRLGFSYVQFSPGDQILILPQGPSLYVVSADGGRYLGLVEVDGYMEDALVTLPECASQEWEMFEVT